MGNRKATAEQIEDAILGILRGCAAKGFRCPTNNELALMISDLGMGCVPYEQTVFQMAKRGLFRCEVYGQNWRVVEIDGKRTMDPRHGGEPHKVMGP